jgi:hypothetical protein
MRAYDELGLPGHGIGNMVLSKTFASFSELRGHFSLRYSGILPAESGSRFAGAHVFRILNPSLPIVGVNRICLKPPKWLGVGSVEHPGQPGEIWVTLFETDDYRTFKADEPGLCAAFAYVPHGSSRPAR